MERGFGDRRGGARRRLTSVLKLTATKFPFVYPLMLQHWSGQGATMERLVASVAGKVLHQSI